MPPPLLTVLRRCPRLVHKPSCSPLASFLRWSSTSVASSSPSLPTFASSSSSSSSFSPPVPSAASSSLPSSSFPSASSRLSQRYRRIPGEPALAFFLRERNSLCAYPREVQPQALLDPSAVQRAVDEEEDLALLRLERKLEMTAGLQRDAELRGPPSLTPQRHEVPSQRRQRQLRQRAKAEKGRKLMAILKFLLHFKEQ